MFKQILILSIIFLSLISVCSGEILYKARFANHSTCIDDSIYQNHGTYNNIQFDTGIRNGAAIFNDVNSSIVVNNPLQLSFTDDISDKQFSTSFWVNRQGSAIDDPIISKGLHPHDCEYIITTVGDEPKEAIILYDYVNGHQLSCITQSYLYEYDLYNGWLHVFMTYDGTGSALGLNIYLNGELEPCDKSGHPSYVCMSNLTSSLNIGLSAYAYDREYLHGKLDELIFYDYEVPATEIKHIYDSYIFEGYSLTFIDNDLISSEKNISVYNNNEYVKTIKYGESINISNVIHYSFIIHEDNFDRFSHIENIGDTTNKGITYLTYGIFIIGAIALLVYFYRRF